MHKCDLISSIEYLSTHKGYAILDDYQNLKPWVKEGIVRRIGQADEPNEVTSRYPEVKYRIHNELYPEMDEFAHHDIDEDEIAKTLLPYIKSLYEIYSRMYPTSNFSVTNTHLH